MSVTAYCKNLVYLYTVCTWIIGRRFGKYCQKSTSLRIALSVASDAIVSALLVESYVQNDKFRRLWSVIFLDFGVEVLDFFRNNVAEHLHRFAVFVGSGRFKKPYNARGQIRNNPTFELNAGTDDSGNILGRIWYDKRTNVHYFLNVRKVSRWVT